MRAAARCRPRLRLRGIPVLPLHYPSPTAATSRPSRATTSRPSPAVGTSCSCRDPGCGQAGKHPLGSPGPPRGQGRHQQPGPGAGLVDPATPKPTSAWPPATASTSWTSTAPPAHRPSGSWPPPMACANSEPLVRTGEVAGTTTAPRPAYGQRPSRPAWSMWIGGAGVAMWSPHPAATPAAVPTSGPPAATCDTPPGQVPAVLLVRASAAGRRAPAARRSWQGRPATGRDRTRSMPRARCPTERPAAPARQRRRAPSCRPRASPRRRWC